MTCNTPGYDGLDNRCYDCNGKVVYDGINGEIVCVKCGIVIEERLEEAISFDNTNPFLKVMNAAHSSLLIGDRGLSTYVGNQLGRKSHRVFSGVQKKANIDNISEPTLSQKEPAFGSGSTISGSIDATRLARLNSISISDTSITRNLNKAGRDLVRVCNLLGLTSSVAESAAYHYRKALQKKLVRGRSIPEFVSASIYLVCKERMIPRTMDEICSALGTDRAFAIHCYKLLLKELDIKPPLMSPLMNISRISARCKIDEKVTRRAIALLEKIQKHPRIEGKHPVVIAAAALYHSWSEINVSASKAIVADAAGISGIALRNRLVDIRFVLAERTVRK